MRRVTSPAVPSSPTAVPPGAVAADAAAGAGAGRRITPAAVGLGLDAGGTQTRWALATTDGTLLAQGSGAPLSGLQLASADGLQQAQATLQTLAAASGPVQALLAGVTGLDATQAPLLASLLAHAWGLPLQRVRAVNDIELVCLAAQAQGQARGQAGETCVLYAGTGSVAALIDAQGRLQRVGGRGALIDDAGGGHWIARQALCRVWRAEDETPGAWRQSPLAQRLFDRIGGPDWAQTRHWVYGATRGELGTLALAVAEAVRDGDAAALQLLQQAGAEMARLARALLQRHGPRTLVLAGRAWELHPAMEEGLAAALPPGTPVQRLALPPVQAAALAAAQKAAEAAAQPAARGATAPAATPTRPADATPAPDDALVRPAPPCTEA